MNLIHETSNCSFVEDNSFVIKTNEREIMYCTNEIYISEKKNYIQILRNMRLRNEVNVTTKLKF